MRICGLPVYAHINTQVYSVCIAKSSAAMETIPWRLSSSIRNDLNKNTQNTKPQKPTKHDLQIKDGADSRTCEYVNMKSLLFFLSFFRANSRQHWYNHKNVRSLFEKSPHVLGSFAQETWHFIELLTSAATQIYVYKYMYTHIYKYIYLYTYI